MLRYLLSFFLVLCYSVASAQILSPTANILYVDQSVSGGTGDGSSWDNAVPELADALKWANANKTSFTTANKLQIWVAKGTYKPKYTPEDGKNFSATPTDNRDKAFLMVENVDLYGGFNGTETSISERELSVEGIGLGTVLSGDLNNNDAANIITNNLLIHSTRQDNVYHVILAASNTADVNITLDGFEIKGGNANSTDGIYVNEHFVNKDMGGGIYSASATNSTVNIRHSTVNNNAANHGGGIYCSLNSSSSSSIINVSYSSISNNTATTGGGGISSYGRFSSIVNLSHSSINYNTADNGAGVNSSSSTNSATVNLNHSNINNNVAYERGGGIFSYCYSASSKVNLSNSSISNNTAINGPGGGLYFYSDSFSTANIKSSTLVANKGSSYIYLSGGTRNLNVHNSIIYGNINADNSNSSIDGNPNKNIQYSLVQGISNTTSTTATDIRNNNLDGTNTNITLANLFINAAISDYSLKANSPVINKGSNSIYVSDIGNSASDKDLAGNPRLYQGIIDMGAYEYQNIQIMPDANNILYVNTNVSGGLGDGSSWDNAIKELADALKWANTVKANFTAASPLKIWVAKGTYKPMYSPQDGENFGTDQNRSNTFLMVSSVLLYGGFVGTETDINQRILPKQGIGVGAVLSGDIGIADDYTDNTYHVVLAANASAVNIRLDGFEITGGYDNATGNITVNGQNFNNINGAGILAFSLSSVAITLNNTNVYNNTTTRGTARGGGIYANSLNSSTYVTLNNSSINNNYVTATSGVASGGGIYANSSATAAAETKVDLNNSSVRYNFANGTSGGNGGGIYASSVSSPTKTAIWLNNSELSNNAVEGIATDGAAIYTYSQNESNINLNSSTLAGNKGTSYLYFSNGSKKLNVNNSIVYGNVINASSSIPSTLATNSGNVTKAIKYSLVQGESSIANGNLMGTTDPLFIDAAAGNYALQLTSPAINAGNNQLYTEGGGDLITDKDLAGNPRLFDNAIDIGAYERQLSPINNILYVNTNVTAGTRDGSSWANAIPELADALKWANANKTKFTLTSPLKIWVAKGTYKPMYSPEDGQNFSASPTNARDKSFLMVENVELYGGFAGTETSIEERTLPKHGIGVGTILSGDLDDNDTYDNNPNSIIGNATTNSTNTGNAYHVVIVASNTTEVNIRIDGFEIKAGHANGSSSITVNGISVSQNTGGGIKANFSGTSLSRIKLSNLSLSNNTASSSGGGIYYSGNNTSVSSEVELINSSLSNNSSSYGYGGGIYASSSISSAVTLINSSLSNNASFNSNGGGIYSYASSSSSSSKVNLSNSTLIKNSAYMNGGGITSVGATSEVSLINSSLVNNVANNGKGSGIFSLLTSNNNTNIIHIKSSTISANKGKSCIYFESGNPKLNVDNSIFYGNVMSDIDLNAATIGTNDLPVIKDIKYSLVQGEEADGTRGNIAGSTDPLFTDAANGNYTLKNNSPAINAGSNSLFTGLDANSKDLAGNPRLFDGTIEMGAYENQIVQVLPVSFGTFTASKQANNIKLTWNTFSETNNKGFIVQKSTDGINFSTLAFVDSKGVNGNNYTLNDNQPANGANYYHLIQLDTDGETKHLGTEVVNYVLAKAEVKAWPNPVNDFLNISFEAGKYIQLIMVDINGKQLQNLNLTKSQSVAQLNLATYPKGVYVVQLKGFAGNHQIKVIKY